MGTAPYFFILFFLNSVRIVKMSRFAPVFVLHHMAFLEPPPQEQILQRFNQLFNLQGNIPGLRAIVFS